MFIEYYYIPCTILNTRNVKKTKTKTKNKKPQTNATYTQENQISKTAFVDSEC